MSLRGDKKEVMLIHPEDYRYDILEVTNETDLCAVTKPHNGVVRRLWKHGPALSQGKTYRFLAVEGRPVTTWLTDDEKEVEGSIKQFLTYSWGEEVYRNLPVELKRKIETDWMATVSVQPVYFEDVGAVQKLKSDEWLFESDLMAMDNFGKSTPKKDWKSDLVNKLMLLAVGAFGMYFFVKQGII